MIRQVSKGSPVDVSNVGMDDNGLSIVDLLL